MKYQIEISGKILQSGFFTDDNEYNALLNKVEFLKSVVKDGIEVKLVTWSPNR